MIEISISRELADEHPGFVAGCAERGHRVEVFAGHEEPPESGHGPASDSDVADEDGPLSPVWRHGEERG